MEEKNVTMKVKRLLILLQISFYLLSALPGV